MTAVQNMTEIKQEPLDPEENQIEIKQEVQEIVEVKDPLDIKLEPVVEDLPALDTDDENLDDLDKKSSSEEFEISDNEQLDKDFEPSEKSESEDIDVENDSEAEKEPLDEDTNEVTTSIELNGMTIVQKGQYSKCPKCKKFIKSTFIIRHIKLHDAKEDKTVCPHEDCNITFAKINNMFRHLRNVHKSKEPFVCKHCGKRFAKSKSLASHLALHRAEKRKLQEDSDNENDNSEQNETRYTCEFPGCHKSYGKKHHLKEHERKHTGDMKFACQVCSKKFYMQNHLKRHMYSHTGLKPHVCRWKCGLTFASYGGRMKHERINHYEENPLESECDVCGRPFRNQQQLVKHRMTHLNPEERKEYRCSYCHIMFDTIKIRQRHEKRHQEGDNFACQECERTFTNEKNLAHHVKHHHNTEGKPPPDGKKRSNKKKNTENTSVKSAPKTHPCHLCTPTKMFCLTSLRRHLARIHSTNFKCEKCGKCFQEESRYKSHLEIHRLRECHLCGKVFARKQNADIHLIGLHGLTPKELGELGRWNPRKETDECPEYMTRASHKSKAEIERDELDEIEIKEEPLDS